MIEIGLALVCWFLAAFGAAFVLGHSKISLGLREVLAGSPAVPFEGTRYEEGKAPIEIHARDAIPPLVPGGEWVAALLECPACLGWWFGFVAGASGFVALPTSLPWWGAGLFLAFATSATNLILAKKVEMPS